MFAPDGTLLAFGEDEEVGPEQEGYIWRLTPAGADLQAKGEVEMSPQELFVAEGIPTFEPQLNREQPNSVMSLVPENSTEGSLYLSGYHTRGNPAPLVLHYSHPSGAEPAITEVGWTAGAGENEKLGPEPCALHKADHEPIMLGGLGGPGAKRGLLAFTFYEEEIAPGTKTPRAEAVQFGEEGSTAGCPTVPVTTPTQEYHAQPTTEVPASSKPLEVTSVLGKLEAPAAAAKSVTWTVKFTGPHGETETKHVETAYEYNGLHEEEPGYGFLLKLQLEVARAGTYEITDVVHTDDLADEVAQPAVADKLIVTPGKLEVKPETPEPAEVRAHEQEATLKAIVEVPGEATLHIKKVAWAFGDGTESQESGEQHPANPATLEAKHTFNRCGSLKVAPCKVKVTVVAETAEGSKEEKVGEVEIKVRESKEEEAAEHPPIEETPPTTTTTTTTTPTSTTPTETTPKGGVAGYIASFTGSSLSVSSSGATSVTITCPSGGACSGTLTLQTANAVAASHKKHAKKTVLTLASAPFSLAGGGRSVALRLGSAAMALLRGSHGLLRAKLTILSRGTGGRQNSTSAHVVTLRLAAKKSHKR